MLASRGEKEKAKAKGLEVARWLRACAVLAEDMSSAPAPTSSGSKLPEIRAPGDPTLSSDFLGHLHSGVHTHIPTHTYTYLK